jgi:hypothetical protein
MIHQGQGENSDFHSPEVSAANPLHDPLKAWGVGGCQEMATGGEKGKTQLEACCSRLLKVYLNAMSEALAFRSPFGAMFYLPCPIPVSRFKYHCDCIKKWACSLKIYNGEKAASSTKTAGKTG